MVTRTVLGRIHGNAIEFDENLGLSDGQLVEVAVRAVPASRAPGAGLLRTEGALADDPEWDEVMEEIYRARKLERSERTDEP